MSLKKKLVWQGREFEVELSPTSNGAMIATAGSKQFVVRTSAGTNGKTALTVDNRPVAVSTYATNGAVEVCFKGRSYHFETLEPGRQTTARAKQPGSLQSPMPGVVSSVLVAEGDIVEAYQPLMVVEAMKVMATLEAPFAGKVQKLLVRKGDQVKQGETLVEMEPTKKPEESIS